VARIVVVGSIARDEVIRLAEPLIPGRHLNGIAAGARLGGGGANTAMALAGAGHEVTLVTAVGRDDHGDVLLAELVQAGVDVSAVARLDCPTTHSLILVDPGGERTVVNVARCDEDAPPARLLGLAADAVYVRSGRRDLAPLLEAKAASSLVLAHVPPVENGSRPAHILVASASDIGDEMGGRALTLGRDIAGRSLRWFVLTAGAAGARATSEEEVLEARAEAVKTVDTTGAGDAFAAGLLHALVSGKPMAEALAVAVRFGTEATLWPTSALPPAAVRRLVR